MFARDKICSWLGCSIFRLYFVKLRVSENCTDGNYAEVDHSFCKVVLTGFTVQTIVFEGKQAS